MNTDDAVANTILNAVAFKFVDVALGRRWWAMQEQDLPSEDAQILLNTVLMAGFESANIGFGEVFGHYAYPNGALTGETFPINTFTKFKLTDKEGRNDLNATGWLDTALSRVYHGLKQQKESREKLVKVMIREIERSNPLAPVDFGGAGVLCEKRPLIYDTYFVDHTRDNHEMCSCVGVHRFYPECQDGFVDRMRATKNEDMLICRNCGSGIRFPKEAKTYGDLRKAGLDNKVVPIKIMS